MRPNIKVVINNKIYDVDGYSLSRQQYMLLDGRIVGFDAASRVLQGTGMDEYQYSKFTQAKEIYEGDILKFFSKYNQSLMGRVYWAFNKSMWRVDIFKNKYGYEDIALSDCICTTVVRNEYQL
ncbi:MAG: hypothetical protein LBU09_02265 [Endomicrobium sp.]|jgi:hypothetical protein|nr:hypothetical protein [Endomicrobium sp.]